MMAKRLGLTMRVEGARDYPEPRDALAHDWAAFLADALGDVPWLAIPNLGPAVVRCLQRWEIDALILTGGNDLGESDLRDETERHALQYCLSKNLPVLGVCRGLQMIQVFFGGSLQQAAQFHAGKNHSSSVCNDLGREILGRETVVVNSFHRQGVAANRLAPGLEPWLLSEDGLVEGLVHRGQNLMAVQWHPERSLPDPAIARRLIRCFIGSGLGSATCEEDSTGRVPER